MNKFCFLIPRTPSGLRTELRDILWEACKRSLINQIERNWTAIVIGEDKVKANDNRFIYIEGDEIWKMDKLKIAIEFLKSMEVKPEYLIRLDDDDLFSKKALINLKGKQFDCAFDSNHAFVELTTRKVSLQERDWIPNTAIHKFEHAIKYVEYNNTSEMLLIHDHDISWKDYYRNKNVIKSDFKTPLYIRILSPTSITSLSNNSDNSLKDYRKYLMKFGNWQYDLADFPEFVDSCHVLNKAGRMMIFDKSVIFSIYDLMKNRILKKLVDYKNKLLKNRK